MEDATGRRLDLVDVLVELGRIVPCSGDSERALNRCRAAAKDLDCMCVRFIHFECAAPLQQLDFLLAAVRLIQLQAEPLTKVVVIDDLSRERS